MCAAAAAWLVAWRPRNSSSTMSTWPVVATVNVNSTSVHESSPGSVANAATASADHERLHDQMPEQQRRLPQIPAFRLTEEEPGVTGGHRRGEQCRYRERG